MCDQGSDVSVSYLAAGCTRGSAHRRIRHSGGRFAQDGNVWIHALLAAFLSRGCVASQSAELDDRDLAGWNNLWRAGFSDAERHEETRRGLVRHPLALLHAG